MMIIRMDLLLSLGGHFLWFFVLGAKHTWMPTVHSLSNAHEIPPDRVTLESSLEEEEEEEKNQRRSTILDQFFAAKDEPNDATLVSQALLQEIRDRIANQTDFLINIRRKIHQNPELMYQEKETSETIQKILSQWDIPFTTGWGINIHPDVYVGRGGYGIVADIGTGESPCVLLRADMDALPILEQTTTQDFNSQNTGIMHACGHDGHSAMLLTAAFILNSLRDSIRGTIRIMFQPAEEGGAGAKRMREEGVLEKHPKPNCAFALHVRPTLPSGVLASRTGPMLAACDFFEIQITGVGGHAAMPHLTKDPIVTAASIVLNLQSLVSRAVSPLESAVCSVTMMKAGDTLNVIPPSAILRGTIRALSTEKLLYLRHRVSHIAQTTAAIFGCQATITYSPDYYPVMINDPELYDKFSKPVGVLVASQVLETEPPSMGAEDFAFVAEGIPSTLFWLGTGSGQNPPTNYGLHHPKFALDETVLPLGVELLCNLALRALLFYSRKEKQADGTEQVTGMLA